MNLFHIFAVSCMSESTKNWLKLKKSPIYESEYKTIQDMRRSNYKF